MLPRFCPNQKVSFVASIIDSSPDLEADEWSVIAIIISFSIKVDFERKQFVWPVDYLQFDQYGNHISANDNSISIFYFKHYLNIYQTNIIAHSKSIKNSIYHSYSQADKFNTNHMSNNNQITINTKMYTPHRTVHI